MQGHRDFSARPLVWDLTNNVNYTFWKDPSYHDKLPCLLRGHVYWHVGKARPVLSSVRSSSNSGTSTGTAEESLSQEWESESN